MNAITQRQETAQRLSPVEELRGQVDRRAADFAAALPPHIPPERFARVVLTAVVSDPDLMEADRASLFESAFRAAQDGLLPDKREGAFVVFNSKIKRDGKEVWVKKVQWMPMIAGVLKKMNNSGLVSTVVARVVYEGDKYRHWIDDTGEHLEYEAAEPEVQNRSVVRRVFAMARMKDGSIKVEEMTPAEVEKIRNVSKAKDSGPWKTWWDQMAMVRVTRRLSKWMPSNADIDQMWRNDNDLFDMGAPAPQLPAPSPLAQRLQQAKASSQPTRHVIEHTMSEIDGPITGGEPDHDAVTGKVIEDDTAEGYQEPQGAPQGDGVFPGDLPSGQTAEAPQQLAYDFALARQYAAAMFRCSTLDALSGGHHAFFEMENSDAPDVTSTDTLWGRIYAAHQKRIEAGKPRKTVEKWINVAFAEAGEVV